MPECIPTRMLLLIKSLKPNCLVWVQRTDHSPPAFVQVMGWCKAQRSFRGWISWRSKHIDSIFRQWMNKQGPSGFLCWIWTGCRDQGISAKEILHTVLITYSCRFWRGRILHVQLCFRMLSWCTTTQRKMSKLYVVRYHFLCARTKVRIHAGICSGVLRPDLKNAKSQVLFLNVHEEHLSCMTRTLWVLASCWFPIVVQKDPVELGRPEFSRFSVAMKCSCWERQTKMSFCCNERIQMEIFVCTSEPFIASIATPHVGWKAIDNRSFLSFETLLVHSSILIPPRRRYSSNWKCSRSHLPR